MRRAAALVLVVVAAFALAARSGDGGGDYRVDAVFDNAASLIAGQDVKIAGARVGQVRDVTLTRDRRARVEMEIEEGFAPFRTDARCTIRPQSLIGEKFVQCDPGTTRGDVLAADDSGTPTVPIGRTSSPVDLDLLFAALRRPTNDRLAIVIAELGSGLAGRPRELSETIRRANPALREVRDVLEILDRDRSTLRRLVERSDEVLARLAGSDRRLASLVERADVVAGEAASRRDGLEESIRRLPPLLAELEPASRDLATLTEDATPLVRELRVAAPSLRALADDIGPLADAARPTLAEIGRTSRQGRRAVRELGPIVDRVPTAVRELVPLVPQLRDLGVSLRDRGVVESLLRFLKNSTLANSRFDAISHIAPSYQIGGACNTYAREPTPGCDAHIGSVEGAAGAADSERGSRRPARRRSRGDGPAERSRPPRRSPAPDSARPPTRELPLDLGEPSPISPLLDFLLGS